MNNVKIIVNTLNSHDKLTAKDFTDHIEKDCGLNYQAAIDIWYEFQGLSPKDKDCPAFDLEEFVKGYLGVCPCCASEDVTMVVKGETKYSLSLNEGEISKEWISNSEESDYLDIQCNDCETYLTQEEIKTGILRNK